MDIMQWKTLTPDHSVTIETEQDWWTVTLEKYFDDSSFYRLFVMAIPVDGGDNSPETVVADPDLEKISENNIYTIFKNLNTPDRTYTVFFKGAFVLSSFLMLAIDLWNDNYVQDTRD